MIFTGFAVSCLILPKFADMYGRRPFFIGGLIAQLIIWVCALMTTNLYIFYVLSFLFGCTITARYTLGFVCYIETIPRAYQKSMTLMINMTETVSILVATLYFAFIGRSWWVL